MRIRGGNRARTALSAGNALRHRVNVPPPPSPPCLAVLSYSPEFSFNLMPATEPLSPAPLPSPAPSPATEPFPLPPDPPVTTAASSTPTLALISSPPPDLLAPTSGYQGAPRSGMHHPVRVGPSREITAYGSPGSSLTSLSCSILATELHASAMQSFYDHFKEVVIEEITKLLCPQSYGNISQEAVDVTESICVRGPPDSAETMDKTPPHFSQMAPHDGSISQEPADVPEYICVGGPPVSVDTMDRTPPHFSQMTPSEAPIPTAMKNNSPYLALVWQNESHVTMIKLADDPSKQMEDFLSDNHASGRFSACYRAPIKNIQEASKSDILKDLNVNFDLHNQQDLERSFLCNAPKGPLKKRRSGKKSSKALSGPNQLKGNCPIDQASSTNVDASPTSPLKKKRRRNAPSQKIEVEPTNVGASPTSPLKKRRRRNVPSQKVEVEPTNVGGSLTDPLMKRRRRIVSSQKVENEPTNVGTSPTSAPKKNRRVNVPRQKVEVESSLIIQEASKSKTIEDLNVHVDLHNQQVLDPSSSNNGTKGLLKKRRRGDKSSKCFFCYPTVGAPSHTAISKSQQDLKLVSSSTVLYTEKEKFPRHPGSNGSARTSIHGWQWLEWSGNASQAEKASIRAQNGTQQNPQVDARGTQQSQQVDARASRLKIRNLLARASYPGLANSMQIKGRVKELRIERSKIHGWGLRAVNQIKEGDLIVSYIGEVIRMPISDMRGLQYENAGICDYFFKIDVNYVIDATFRGGVARYINHSCEPNCTTRVISVDGAKKVFIYAKRWISEGEELTYNYNFPIDEKKIPCLCRSRRCRGSMN